MKKTILTIIFSLATFLINAQKEDKVTALNNYINFANESTHGLLIIHRLLENYNQEINKFVDLKGYNINNISNSDLPRNIFKDEEHWFYQTTPYEWFDKIKTDTKFIGMENHNSLYPIAKNLLKTINQINNIRFKIANLISSHNLKEIDNLNAIYTELEKAVDLFDLYYAYVLNLDYRLSQIYPSSLKTETEKSFLTMYNKSMDLLKAIRIKNRGKIKMENGLLTRAFNKYKKHKELEINNKCKQLNSKILTSIKDILLTTKGIELSPKVPGEYRYYGKHYYYYNVSVIDNYNRYGNGFILYFNQLIKYNKINSLYKLELPHYFKVIKPKKKIKKIDLIESSISDIVTIPKTIEGRKIKYNKVHIIEVDKTDIELQLFDYKIQDGDIVSINFNGDWIYKNLSLETKPKQIKLKLNKKGKNFIVLHAVNVGRRPPNTIGINYNYKNEKKTIILESNLQTSDMVEFVIKDNK